MAHQGAPPNYYAILGVPETASTQQIRDAYKRAALKTHPDRLPADSPERPERTRRFQLVNDAYYALSDPTRRREYDAQRRLFGGFSSRGGGGGGASEPADPFAEGNNTTDDDAGPGAAQSGFSWAWNFFGGGNNNNNNNNAAGGSGAQQARQQAEEAQFGDVFEEMLREEGMAEPGTGRPTGKFWSMVGGASGAALGFIVANVPGLLAGAVAGNRLGAVRDAKGKSVYAVFQVSLDVDIGGGGGGGLSRGGGSGGRVEEDGDYGDGVGGRSRRRRSTQPSPRRPRRPRPRSDSVG